jgi:hypothetical protein
MLFREALAPLVVVIGIGLPPLLAWLLAPVLRALFQ